MKRIGLTLIWLATLACPCLGQEPAAERTPFDGPSRVEVPKDGTAVPLEKAGPFYFAQVEVGGKPFRFTIETGANHVSVSRGLVDQLGLQVGTASVVRLPALRIGAAVFIDVVARVTPGFNQEPAFDGLISIPLLRGVVATFDFPRRELRLGGRLPSEIATEIDYRLGERVEMPILAGGKRLSAVLDTRSPLGLILPDSLLPEVRLAGPLGEPIRAGGPSLGEFTLRPAPIAGELSVGGRSAPNPTVYFRDRPGVVLGMPILEQFVVTLDLANRRAALTMPPGQALTVGQLAAGASPLPEPPPVYLGFGLVPQPGGGKVVTAVAPGSSAAKEGLRDGDRLVSLDGVPAEQVDPSVLRRAAAKGTPIKVVVLRDGRRLELDVLPHSRRE
ncbi:MAG TPA: aspartyl protease family protein [Thermoanaerobaculia bacterium]|nr:aspartyl protease family protein [Thermoanaerobaculia bacterium]